MARMCEGNREQTYEMLDRICDMNIVSRDIWEKMKITLDFWNGMSYII